MGVVAQWKRAKASPLNQRRWLQFKANKRGYWSFWLFLLLFVGSMFAEFIANDKPVLIRYQQQWMMPIVSHYTELEFGGDLDIEADYSDPYIQELIEEQGGWMIWPPVHFSYDTINYNLTEPSPSPPTLINWLGTDDQGRDVFARLLYGFRLSVLFALVLAISSSVIGVAVGAMQGYFGGRVDLLGQRFIEIWSGMPQMFLLIILSSLVQPSFWWLLGILLLFSWMSLVDVVRAEFLRGRNLEYVKAARALGVGDRAIMARHILPNAMIATLTFMPFIFIGGLTALTALDYLGFGLPPGSPSLGEMVAQGKNNLQAPWLGITAFFSMSIILILLVFIGEAARDAFDPRKRV
ncbi:MULTISPECIES: ABC transporter permease [unclassified Agarivorans]|uniref:ABC transporter permease n=1 Tax=unclassified Agarivorans TaxID=2636026 RepID=UPI0026E300DF|nr:MULTISPECIES: ABC transporter permease [unclassified Agarivorans]MDO6687667.1 ABC transporter permease [Agarivorans sp. 3_MG-2023]MDO6717221.1 ABC transporter permease [Agarivorans sp. 2_MG-2023]MDO6765789.1 ABC transporter permease [Agarivorans sp. 1_MG-2023]